MAVLTPYNEVDSQFRSFLATGTGKQIGLCRVPAKDNSRDELAPLSQLNMPYAIIYPMASPRAEGSWAQPEEDRELVYQITCVGIDPLQARWMSDKVREVITARQSSDYEFPWTLTTPEGNVQCRHGDAVGAILESGVDLYQTNDMYRIYVGA